MTETKLNHVVLTSSSDASCRAWCYCSFGKETEIRGRKGGATCWAVQDGDTRASNSCSRSATCVRSSTVIFDDRLLHEGTNPFLWLHTLHRVNGCASGYGFTMHRAFNFPETCEHDFGDKNCSLINLWDIPLQKQFSSAEERRTETRLLQSGNLSLPASSYALIHSSYTPPCLRAQRRLLAEV